MNLTPFGGKPQGPAPTLFDAPRPGAAVLPARTPTPAPAGDTPPQSPAPAGDPTAPKAPQLEELSEAGQIVARTFARFFIGDLLEAPEHTGQASETRARRRLVGCNACGVAVRHLHRLGLIERVTYAPSLGRARKGGVEGRWRLSDAATARAWLATQGGPRT